MHTTATPSSAHYIQCTFGPPKGKPVYYWPTSRVSCLVDAAKMFEEMVWFGYLPAPVAEVDQKMKQDATG